MYSPKIKEDYIPDLYRQAKICKMPMTRLVNRIIGDYLQQLKKANRENMARQITQDILKGGDTSEQPINSRAGLPDAPNKAELSLPLDPQ